MSLNEMNSVAGDALENLRRSLLSEATAELQRQSREHLQEYQQGVRRHMSEGQQEVQVQQGASREEVENLRREFSLSLLLKDDFIRLCTRQANLVRPKIHQVSSCDMSVNI